MERWRYKSLPISAEQAVVVGLRWVIANTLLAVSEPMTGGAALARQLRAQGVEVIFGLPGDQLMAALDALVDVPEIRYLVTRHEQATTYMADGYARAGGRPGVAMVVPGVGVYNAAAGLATAYACSSPVLLIAGQVNRDGIGRDLGLLHDLHDQLDVVRRRFPAPCATRST